MVYLLGQPSTKQLLSAGLSAHNSAAQTSTSRKRMQMHAAGSYRALDGVVAGTALEEAIVVCGAVGNGRAAWGSFTGHHAALRTVNWGHIPNARLHKAT